MNDEIRYLIGHEIRKLRTKARISQEQLAEMSNVHPTYIGQLERGEKNVSVDRLQDILTSLNITLSEFFKSIDTYYSIDKNKQNMIIRLMELSEEQLKTLCKIADIIF